LSADQRAGQAVEDQNLGTLANGTGYVLERYVGKPSGE
jgi:hypothetical protein